MLDSLDRFISEALDEPAHAVSYKVSRRLADLFPDRALIESVDYDFQLFEYVRAGLCTIRLVDAVHPQVLLNWTEDRGVYQSPRNVWYEVQWRGHELDVLHMEWGDCDPHFWILADSEATARRFFEVVCAHNPDLDDEVLVYEGGRWDASAGLHRNAGATSFDDLVLTGTLKTDIHADLGRFFNAESTYKALGAPWKRGILLTGPPGNGKTHTIKALVAGLGIPCLYIKSFKSECFTEETNLRRIFERARRSAPCLMVLEDLDALITDENRAFFLNELDGIATNSGIAIVATTNHPEKLDPAIVERPSRFDRKYHFPLPGPAERLAFIAQWCRGLPDHLQPSAADQARIAERTENFSFAYLKELFLASILARAGATDDAQSFTQILDTQVNALRAQMRPATHPASS